MKTLYDQLVIERGLPALVIPEPTRRQKHRAGRLTGEVWSAICAGTSPSSVVIEDTQEILVVQEEVQ